MSRTKRIIQVMIGAAVAGGIPIMPTRAGPAGQQGSAALPDVTYQPPVGAGEKNRVDGSLVRGSELPGLFVIGSEHTGLTTQEQPSLYYYLQRPPAHCKMVLTVNEELKPVPLAEVPLDASKAGVQRVDLSKTACKLEPGKVYQWVVAIVPDAGAKEKQEASSAGIKRIDPPAALIDQLQPLGSTLDRAVVYARNGIWYDAFGAISDQIDADAGNPRLRSLRAKLCAQVNLPDVAKYDLQAAEAK